jgi:hypothetical protein
MASMSRCNASTIVVPPCGADQALDGEPVDVQRLPLHTVGDLLARDQEEAFVGAEQRIERVGSGDEVVVAEDEELVAVLAIPPCHVVGRRIAVGVERVGVRVPLVPAHCGGRGLRRHSHRTRERAQRERPERYDRDTLQLTVTHGESPSGR